MPLLVFFNEKCVLHQPPQIPSVFSRPMRLAFTVTVNSYETRPTAPGFRIFFQLKRASRKPFQIPCVFSSKTRLAFNVTVNLYDSQPTAPTFLVFFQRKRASQESYHIPRVHFRCVFSGTMRLGFTRQCEFTCDAASPCRMSFLFPRENAPRRNRRDVSKLEQRHMLTKEHYK